MKRKKALKILSEKAKHLSLDLSDVVSLIRGAETDDELREVLQRHVCLETAPGVFGELAVNLTRKLITVNLAIDDLARGREVDTVDVQEALDL